jgi:hypothetical protein
MIFARILFLFLLTGVLWASGTTPPISPVQWADLPSSVWKKPSSGWGQEGALVLEDHLRVNMEPGIIEWTYRVRIFNTAGQKAGAIQKWSGEISQVDARVSYPDGTSVLLNKESDFASKNMIEHQGATIKRAVLVPPGITSDCVMELHIKSSRRGLPSAIEAWRLGGPFPTQVLVLEVGISHDLSVLVVRPKNSNATVTKTEGSITTTFHDLPPFEEALAYGVTTAASVPTVFIYFPYHNLSYDREGGVPAFWEALSHQTWKPYYDFTPFEPDKIDSGRFGYQIEPRTMGVRYKALSRELLADLPESPQAATLAIYDRLLKRVQRWSHVSKKVSDALEKREIKIESDRGRDFERTIENGGTTSLGWMQLFYRLLKDKGLKPHLVKLTSSYRQPFLPSLLSEYQFPWTVLCVEEPGKPPLWIDPDLLFSPPGHLPVWCQGMTGMLIDTDSWNVSILRLPWQKSEAQLSSYSYQIRAENGLSMFDMDAHFVGPVADRIERMTYLKLIPTSRAEILQKQLEDPGLETSISSVNIVDPEDQSQPYHWSAKGYQRLSRGARMLIRPFPSLPRLIELEDNLPMARIEPIHLGAPRKQQAESTVQIPPGYHWRPQPPFERKSEFGSVKWIATESDTGEKVHILMEIDITKGIADASTYHEFRRFLTHIKSAVERSVILEATP